jgi:hypothetical protein
MMTLSGSSSSDEYWRDDFRPLRDAGREILSFLRQDENSPHGDLYRRIIAKNSSSSSSGSSSLGTNNNAGGGAGGGGNNPTTTTTAVSDAESNPDHRYFFNDEVTTSVQHVGTIPLPPPLQEKRKHVKISTMMGLFPPGELAWLTIDDTVYLWSYNSSLDGTLDGAANAGVTSQMIQYQMPSKQPIVSVGLAPPKPGKSSK